MKKPVLQIFLSSLLLGALPAGAESLAALECAGLQETIELETTTGQPEPEKARLERLIAEADCLRKTAAMAGSEWLETGALLSRSNEEAGMGNWAAALQLVAKARLQAEQALLQAEKQAATWESRVID